VAGTGCANLLEEIREALLPSVRKDVVRSRILQHMDEAEYYIMVLLVPSLRSMQKAIFFCPGALQPKKQNNNVNAIVHSLPDEQGGIWILADTKRNGDSESGRMMYSSH
jgi:hypothetical protein